MHVFEPVPPGDLQHRESVREAMIQFGLRVFWVASRFESGD